MLTNQQVFDKVFNHAKTQRKEFGDDNAQATGDDGCLYRHYLYDGRIKMCFIGVLIPDSEYNKSMEGNSVSDLFDNHYDMMSAAGLDGSQLHFLRDLQIIHDENMPNTWNKHFVEFAASHELVCSIQE